MKKLIPLFFFLPIVFAANSDMPIYSEDIHKSMVLGEAMDTFEPSVIYGYIGRDSGYFNTMWQDEDTLVRSHVNIYKTYYRPHMSGYWTFTGQAQYIRIDGEPYRHVPIAGFYMPSRDLLHIIWYIPKEGSTVSSWDVE